MSSAPTPEPVPEANVVTTQPLTDSITVRAISRVQAIAVRTVRTYLQALAGLTAAFLFVPVAPIVPGDSTYVLGPFVGAFAVAAQYALLPAIAALLQNLVELLSNMDKTAPGLRA